MKVNERIKTARKEARLTQEDIAEQLEITKGAVSQWESGKTTPRNDLLKKFSRITNKPLDWLMGFDNVSGFGDADEVLLLSGKPHETNENIVSVCGYTTGSTNTFCLGDSLFSVACPAPLLGTRGVYAIIISSDHMIPRYEEGEIIFVDPTRYARPDDYIIARLRSNKTDTMQIIIGKMVRHDSQQLIIRQLNPDVLLYYPADQVIALELIVISSTIR